MLLLLAFTLAVLAGIHLVLLGIAALLRPASVRALLGGHAGSARAHYLEMSIRLIVGAALIRISALTEPSAVLLTFGWVLIGTTLALLAAGWEVHGRIARWSVPRATRRMELLALGSILMGVGLLVAVTLGRTSAE